MADFELAFEKTIHYEGGYSDHPADRGGETYMGISRKYFPEWDGWDIIDMMKERDDFPACLSQDRNLYTMVMEHYRKHYWNVIKGDDIPDQSIANELFDTAVNMGVGTANRFLQEALNYLNRNGRLYPDLVVDGLVGPKTLGALKTYLANDPPRYLLIALNILQGKRYLDIMKRDPTQEVFARGWLKRVEIERTYGLVKPYATLS